MKLSNLFACIVLGVVIGFVFYAVYFMGAWDYEFKKSYQLKMLKNHAINNNLPLIDANPLNITNGWHSDKDLDDWYSYVKDEYKYYKHTYDCKYWSLNWALYFEKHYVDYELIDTDNHIFVMAYYDDKYCIADGDILECYYIVE